MPADLNAYLDSLLADNDELSEEEKTNLRGILGKSPKAATKAVSASLFAEEAERTRAQLQEERQRFIQTNQPIVDRANEILEKYRAGGSGNGPNPPTPAPTVPAPSPAPSFTAPSFDPEAVVKKVLEVVDERLNASADANVGMMRHGFAIVDHYRSTFNKPLPFEAVEQIAIQRHVPLDQAYQIFIKPELDKIEKERSDLAIREAEERGERRAMSRMQGSGGAHVVSISDRADHPIFAERKNLPENFRKLSKEEQENISMANFDKAFNESAGFTKR